MSKEAPQSDGERQPGIITTFDGYAAALAREMISRGPNALSYELIDTTLSMEAMVNAVRFPSDAQPIQANVRIHKDSDVILQSDRSPSAPPKSIYTPLPWLEYYGLQIAKIDYLNTVFPLKTWAGLKTATLRQTFADEAKFILQNGKTREQYGEERRKFIRLAGVSALTFLAACTGLPDLLSPTSGSGATDTGDPPTLSPSVTVTETPTRIPTREPTVTLNPFPQDVQAWMAAHPDFHWQNPPGVTLTRDQLKSRIRIGQGDVLQMYDSDVTWIDFAWDTEQNNWLKASDILQPDRNFEMETMLVNPEHYIRVQTRAQLEAIFSREKLVLPPFSSDTYFPPLDKVITDYQTRSSTNNDAADFCFRRPFGTMKLEDVYTKKPIRPVNFIILEAGEGRTVNTYIVTTQVYNPADGTFSLLHYGTDEFDTHLDILQRVSADSDGWRLLLPVYKNLIRMMPGAGPCGTQCNQIAWLIEHQYIDANGNLPEIRRLVDVWLATGKVPAELEGLILISWGGWYYNPPAP